MLLFLAVFNLGWPYGNCCRALTEKGGSDKAGEKGKNGN